MFFVQSQNLPRQQALQETKGPPAENDWRPRRRPEDLRAPGSPLSWQLTPTAPTSPQQSS